MIELISAILLAAAPAAPGPSEPEQRRIAKEVLDQLLAEDGDVTHFRDHQGHDRIWIASVPRGDEPGLCRRDGVSIERNPKAAGGGIREIDVKRWFYVVTDERDRPLWRLHGDELERRCRAGGPSGQNWFEAGNGFDARMAVQGLEALKAQLTVPDPRRDLWICRDVPMVKRCPDPSAIARRVDPLRPGPVRSAESSTDRCPDKFYCVSVELPNPYCGSWVTQLRMDPRDDYRFHSARAISLAGMLECGERELFDPPAE